MIRDILHLFPKFKVRKVPKIMHTPFGSYWLPTWFAHELDFVSPKGVHYTLYGMAWKYNQKMTKQARKAINKAKQTQLN